MWYVIQTIAGQEEQLTEMIRKMIPSFCFSECFYIKRENAKKTDNGYKITLTPLFASYIFIITDVPEQLYFELKKLPKLTKLLGDCEDTFLCVSKEEQRFLENIQEDVLGHVVLRSMVEVDDEGQIIKATGAVGRYQKQIIKQRLRKRYVMVEQNFLGNKRKIVLGIKLKNDKEI